MKKGFCFLVLIFVALSNVSAHRKPKKVFKEISGVVYCDFDKSPIIGGVVLVKRQKIAELTDRYGQFKLKMVDSASIIEFKQVGYIPEKIKVVSDKTIKVFLKPGEDIE